MTNDSNKKYWLHRITGGDNGWMLSYPLLEEHSILSTGWSDFSQDEFVDRANELGISFIEQKMREEWNVTSLPRNRWNLYNFIHQMKAGNLVVVPMWGGVFGICELLDNEILTNESLPKDYYEGLGISLQNDGYLYSNDGNLIDLGFYRRVKVHHLKINRQEYADQALFSRMKIMQTNADISDLGENVKESIKRADSNNPIYIYKELMQSTLPIAKKIIDNYVQHITYEDLVEKYLWAIGANEVRKPATNESSTDEGDADRVAYFEQLKVAVMVQIKKHDSTTDDWAVNQIELYKNNHINEDYNVQLWVISNAEDFTEEAKRKAREANVRLINGDDFAKMILDVGLKHFM